ncbi:MAG: DMT family transporter [Rhizobiaceae bacterium]|nr:DMT family transporter [Rhizobiaceae bacterium]
MQSRLAYILLLLTCLFWGGNSVAGKVAVGNVSPMLLTALRWGIAFLILLVLGWPRIRNDLTKLRESWIFLLLAGMFGFTVFTVALYGSLVFTTAVNTSIEQAAVPMVIFVANFVLFRLKVSITQVLGFLISIGGVMVVASHGELSRLLALDVNKGDAIMLVAVLVYGVYSVTLRWKPDVHWQSLMAGLTFSAFITALPFVAIEAAYGAVITPTPMGWAVVAYTATLPSIISQMFFIRGVEMIGSNRAGLFINLVPICGTLLSLVILGEEFHSYHAIALVMALGGIWLAERGRKAA